MRADRLISILLIMQARGRVTAGELAEELEMSVVTARRDLEALSASGVPVYSQPGRGGGWSLLGGSRIDLSGLTLGEARALFALLGPTAGADPLVASAVRKLLRALPETFRPDAEFAASAVVPDATAWGQAAHPEPPALAAIRDAVLRRRMLRLRYRGWNGTESDLVVTPLALAEKDGTWYLIAGSGSGSGSGDSVERTYRVDRVLEATATDDPAQRPDGFDPGAAWTRGVAEVDRQRMRVTATIRIESGVLPWLRADFGTGMSESGGPDSQGDLVDVSAQTIEILARRLAGWGDRITVIDPPELRAHLSRIGRELLARA